MNYLTSEPIDANQFISRNTLPGGAGGTVLFFGTVRDQAHQRRVTHLVYEAYEELAERMIDDLIAKAMRIWPVLDVRIQHRVGKVAVGEIAVAIEVVCGHRDEAYKASRFLIDQIKKDVPVWKKEYFEDGIYRWGRCDHAPRSSSPQIFNELTGDRKDIKILSAGKETSAEPEFTKRMAG